MAVEKFKAGDLEQVFQKAHGAGKTPLILNSDIIETFYLYRAVELVEAKKLLMQKAMSQVPVEEQKAKLKEQAMNAMTSGKHLVLCMGNTAVTFNGDYVGEDGLPASIFDWNSREEAWGAVSGGLPAEGVPKEGATKMDGYAFAVLSHFKEEDYQGFLKDSLPLDKCMAFQVMTSEEAG